MCICVYDKQKVRNKTMVFGSYFVAFAMFTKS